MPRPRPQSRRASRIALFVALGAGLSQGAAVVAGYVPGLEARFLAVSALVGFVSLVAAAPEALELKKFGISPIILAVRLIPIVGIIPTIDSATSGFCLYAALRSCPNVGMFGTNRFHG